MKTEMIPVVSSQLVARGYDPETSTMYIQFHGKNGLPGAVYSYANVTPEQYDVFVKSPSLGSHFHTHFKSAKDKHPYKKVPPTAAKAWTVKVMDIRALNDACVNAIMTNDRAMDAIRIALKTLTDAAIASGIADQVPGLSIKQEDETNVR